MGKGGGKKKELLVAKVGRKSLLDALDKASGVWSKKSPIPILSMVVVEAEKDSIYVTATDLEIGLRMRVPGEVLGKGKVAVPGKQLKDMVRAFPGEAVRLEGKENFWVSIGDASRKFDLMGLDPEEFPVLPGVDGPGRFSKMQSVTLFEMVRKTAPFASNEASRYNTTACFLKHAVERTTDSKILEMVGTDGKRLSLIRRKGEIGSLPKIGVLIPKTAMLQAEKIFRKSAEIEVSFSKAQGFIRTEDALMTIRLIDGEYPDYEKVLPIGNNREVRCGRARLIEVFKRILPMTSRSNGAVLTFKNGKMVVAAENTDFGSIKEEVKVLYDGPEFKVGMDVQYLIDALSVFDSEGAILLFGKNEESAEEVGKEVLSPVLFKPDVLGSGGHLVVVMPMRI